MGGGWESGRSRPVVDEQTRETMGERSAWQNLLSAPLPPPPSDSSQARPPGRERE
jgi:hypothetical protein